MYVLISLFAGIIALLVNGYSSEDVWLTMATGLPLLAVVVGLSHGFQNFIPNGHMRPQFLSGQPGVDPQSLGRDGVHGNLLDRRLSLQPIGRLSA